MVSSKFLFDDGEEDEVCLKDWAVSGGVSTEDLLRMERDFLNAIVSNHIINFIFCSIILSVYNYYFRNVIVSCI